MKQMMYGLLLFDNPEARNHGVAVLEAAGFSITFLDWVDEIAGVVVTPTCWIEVRGLYAGSDGDFLTMVGGVANEYGGEAIEAGLQNPPEPNPLPEATNDEIAW